MIAKTKRREKEGAEKRSGQRVSIKVAGARTTRSLIGPAIPINGLDPPVLLLLLPQSYLPPHTSSSMISFQNNKTT
jgi:hypothetical protein